MAAINGVQWHKKPFHESKRKKMLASFHYSVTDSMGLYSTQASDFRFDKQTKLNIQQ